MRLFLTCTVLALVAIEAEAQEPVFEQEWIVRMEPVRKVYDPDKNMPIRFTVENPTDGPMDLAEPVDYTEGLQITDPDGKVIKTYGKTKDLRRLVRSDGKGFIGRTVNVTEVFQIPAGKEGTYTLRWKLGDAESEDIEILVIPDYVAELETTKGAMKIEFLPDVAPRHVLRFLELSRNGFYAGTRFHRVIGKFMMQGGLAKDPKEKTPAPLKAEFSDKEHVRGTVSMALRKGEPNSATTEFFICFSRKPHLDGKYTIFGQVIDGWNTLDKIEKVETDHNPCKGCGRELPPGPTSCCGRHHNDEPLTPLVLKNVTLKIPGREKDKEEKDTMDKEE